MDFVEHLDAVLARDLDQFGKTVARRQKLRHIIFAAIVARRADAHQRRIGGVNRHSPGKDLANDLVLANLDIRRQRRHLDAAARGRRANIRGLVEDIVGANIA